MWRGTRTWCDFTRTSRKERHASELQRLQNHLQGATHERDRLARRLDTLTQRFMDSRHGAFFDTCDRMLKTWKFGSMFGFWRHWHEWAKQTAMARLISSGDQSSVELQKQIQTSNAECGRLRSQLSAREREIAKLTQERDIAVSEINMWKDRLKASDAKIPLSNAAGYARAKKEYERMLQELTSRLLGKINSAFTDKLHRFYRTWQSGQTYLFFTDWKQIVANKPKGPDPNVQKAKINALQKDLDEVVDQNGRLTQHVESLEDQLLNLKLKMQQEQTELQRQVDELLGQLSLLRAQKEASENKLRQDVQQVTQLSEQAMDQANARSTDLIAENTTLKTRHDEFKRLTEDLQHKLAEAVSAKDEMQVREKLRDLDQQSELDTATTQALSKDQRASQAMAQCRSLEELCNDYKKQNEKSSIDAQTANDRVQQQAKEIGKLQEECKNHQNKLHEYEKISSEVAVLSPRSRGRWFQDRAAHMN